MYVVSTPILPLSPATGRLLFHAAPDPSQDCPCPYWPVFVHVSRTHRTFQKRRVAWPSHADFQDTKPASGHGHACQNYITVASAGRLHMFATCLCFWLSGAPSSSVLLAMRFSEAYFPFSQRSSLIFSNVNLATPFVNRLLHWSVMASQP
jgi:hypothetical protein